MMMEVVVIDGCFCDGGGNNSELSVVMAVVVTFYKC